MRSTPESDGPIAVSTGDEVSNSTRTGGGLPRAFDAIAALLGLIATLPLLLGIALAVRLTSSGPALFRQTRVGRRGRPFELLKFRTMQAAPANSPAGDGTAVTVGGDQRVTAVGALLRRTKLDELPELVNVLKGEMALVGPRPEVPAYVDLSNPSWQEVLRRRPGLTSETSLLLRAEEEVLRLGIERTGLDTERFYRDVLLPFKLTHIRDTEARRTAARDLSTLLRTAVALVRPPASTKALVARVLDHSNATPAPPGSTATMQRE